MNIRPFQDKTPKIGAGSYIDPAAAVIGDVIIGKDCSIWPMVAIRGDVHRIRIGDYTNIQDGSILHVTADNEYNPGGHPLTVGNHVTVGHGAILHACTVEDYSLVGMGATVLDGAVVSARVMVGAGALVAPGKVLESGYLYLGSPAKRMRPLSERELAYFEFSSQHYITLKNQYL